MPNWKTGWLKTEMSHVLHPSFQMTDAPSWSHALFCQSHKAAKSYIWAGLEWSLVGGNIQRLILSELS